MARTDNRNTTHKDNFEKTAPTMIDDAGSRKHWDSIPTAYEAPILAAPTGEIFAPEMAAGNQDQFIAPAPIPAEIEIDDRAAEAIASNGAIAGDPIQQID
jgi:hypothetical protein